MNKNITITEALAELKTLEKRIAKKLDNIIPYVFRQEAIRDPLEKQGGSKQYIERELQGLYDLQEHRLSLRRAIQKSNEQTEITALKETRTIADWLMWRREILPQKKLILEKVLQAITQARTQANQQNLSVTTKDSGQYSSDLIINIDEIEVREDLESLEEIDGTLDGLLSLKNATTLIEL